MVKQLEALELTALALNEVRTRGTPEHDAALLALNEARETWLAHHRPAPERIAVLQAQIRSMETQIGQHNKRLKEWCAQRSDCAKFRERGTHCNMCPVKFAMKIDKNKRIRHKNRMVLPDDGEKQHG